MFRLLRRNAFASRLINVKYFSNINIKNYDNLCLQYLDDKDTGIIVLGLNRHKAKNALDRALASNLIDALENVKYDSSARVMIIKSMVPGVFCAGADLKERLTLTQSEVNVFVAKLRNIAQNIEHLPIPVIAAIDGVAVGGGLEIALACDMRTVASSAKLGLVETKLAIIPGAGGTQRLPRLVGPSIAKELIFTSRIIDGTEAYSKGIVNYVVEPNETGDAAYFRALDLAREIIPNGPVGVRMAKVAIDRGLEVDINTGCAIEEACYAQVVPTKDRIEGLTAFKEKRIPIYTGK